MKYRKKPIIVEAYQTEKEFNIDTLEGIMHASIGDYIVTGIDGEQYPVKPNIFENTFLPVDKISQDEIERPHGEWGSISNPFTGEIHIFCSNCKEEFIGKNTLEEWKEEYLFCFRCGADMRGKEK